MSSQHFENVVQEMLNCKIKLFKTSKLLFGHCWAIYCHIGEDKSNTYLIQKPKNQFLFHAAAVEVILPPPPSYPKSIRTSGTVTVPKFDRWVGNLTN